MIYCASRLRLQNWLCCVLFALAFSCSSPVDDKKSAEDKRNGKVRVVATTEMIADIARQIAGERAEVKALMGSGVDPHLYKPTRADIAELHDADLVLYNGLHLEGKLLDAFERLAASGRKIVAVAEAVPTAKRISSSDTPDQFDPHVWMDPENWGYASQAIHQALAQADSSGQSTFDANLKTVQENLKALDNYSREVLNSVGETERVLVTAHDAFSYFGRRYGYQVLGIQGLSTESEAGIKDIERLVSLIVERRIRAVFVESSVPKRSIEALIDGAKARGHQVVIGAELFSDAMGAPGTYEGTYFGMIDHNVTSIAKALGGKTPERGMQGKLVQ